MSCDEQDEFDVEFGMKRAKKILLDNYHKSMDKKVTYFKEDLKKMLLKII